MSRTKNRLPLRLSDQRASSEDAPDCGIESIEACLRDSLQRLDSGETEEAIAGYQRAVELDPWHLEALCGLGLAWLRADRTKLARHTLLRALAVDSRCARAWYGLALCALNEGALAEAREAHERLRQVDEMLALRLNRLMQL